jgi:carbohydrate-selective porin OprB
LPGPRTRLEDDGITPSLTFVSDLAGNPVGGKRRGFTEAENLGLNVNFDLDKLNGYTFTGRGGQPFRCAEDLDAGVYALVAGWISI